MKKSISLFIILSALFVHAEAFALGNPEVDSIVIGAIRQVHDENFFEGIDKFKELIEISPGTPMPYFYIAATYLCLINEYRNPEYRDEFEAYIDSAVSLGEQRAEEKVGTDEDYFYYGAALGYRGIYKSDQGDWWGAFKDGARARGKLEKALEIDSTNYDVYYGLGSYDYWRSAKTKVLWWLPFFSDRREQGIEYMWKAVEKGKYSPNECLYALVRVYHNEKDFEKMFDVWYKYLESINPNDPYAFWWLGDGYAQLGQWGNSEDIYRRLLEAIKDSPYYHPNAEVELSYLIAHAQFNQNNLDAAVSNLEEGIKLEEEIVDYHDAPAYLKKSKELLDRIEKRQR